MDKRFIQLRGGALSSSQNLVSVRNVHGCHPALNEHGRKTVVGWAETECLRPRHARLSGLHLG